MKKVITIIAVCSNGEHSGLVKYLKRISAIPNGDTAVLIKFYQKYSPYWQMMSTRKY